MILVAALGFSLGAVSPVVALDGPEIPWVRDVSLNVGESQVIYGYRGDCGQAPVLSSVRVPATKTGKISFGKKGWRNSNSCGGETPAMQLVFTATQKGREQIKIQGDTIKINVK